MGVHAAEAEKAAGAAKAKKEKPRRLGAIRIQRGCNSDDAPPLIVLCKKSIEKALLCWNIAQPQMKSVLQRVWGTPHQAKGGDSSESPPAVFWLQKTLLTKVLLATMHTGSGWRRPEETSCRTAVQHPDHVSRSPRLFADREPAHAGNGSRWRNCPCPATRSAHPPV